MSSGYRLVLRVSGVRQLLARSVLARLPLGICSLALLLFVRGQTHSFLLAGVAVGCFTLAAAVLAPLQGALVDRFGQPRVLIPCAVAQGALLCALVALAGSMPSGALVVLAAVAGAVTPPVSACLRVLWPVLVTDPVSREAAYTLDAVSQEVIWVLGPLLVALAVTLASAAAALLLGAMITTLGSILFALAPSARRWRGRQIELGRSAGALSSSRLRSVLACAAALGTTIGAVEVGMPALAVRLGSHELAGVLLALWSAGSMAGGVLYGTRHWKLTIGARHTRLLAAGVILIAPMLLVDSPAVGMLVSVLAGLALAPIFSCQYALIGALAPAGAAAEAFTWQTAALVGGIAAGSALGGALIQLGGARLAFVLACAGVAFACALAVAGARRPGEQPAIAG
jgi:MFS family permease